MSEDYRGMWKDMGLDLEGHDALLGVLSGAYRDIFLSQKNRPEGMGYFDFVMSEVHGLRIREILDEKKAGRKIIGSYCVFVPEEIVLAANATLVGLCSGADFAMSEVEKLLSRNTCALIKSSFGFKLGKVCPYLESADMIVGENTCDGKKKAYESLGNLAISSMCTVFAESEVTSLIAKGQSRREIARGLHTSVIQRAAGMINRVSSTGDIVGVPVGLGSDKVVKIIEQSGANVVALENCSGYKQAFCPVRLPYKKEFFHERN